MTFNWWTFLFEALNFVVLAYVLHRLLYRPLREAIDKRRQANVQAQAEAEKARKEAEMLQQRLREQLAAAEQQRQELVHQAHEQAEAERKQLLVDTERATQRRQEEVRQSIAWEREQALKSLRQELIGQAIQLTERLLSQAVDRTLHQQLAIRLVERLRQVAEANSESLRTTWQIEDGAVLETAQDLDSETLGRVQAAVSSLVGKPVALTIQTRPALLGGLRLRIGGQVWDSSLAAPLLAVDQGDSQEARR
jgi:F-type H+-transporting ATPase subunit b